MKVDEGPSFSQRDCPPDEGKRTIYAAGVTCPGHYTPGVPLVFCGVMLFGLTEILLGLVHEPKRAANHGKV